MSTDLNPSLASGAVAASSTKPLWAVVGVLSVAVLGMGGAMLSMRSNQSEPAAGMAPVTSATTALATQAPNAAPNPPTNPVSEQKPSGASTESTHVATKSVAKHVPTKTAPVHAQEQAPVAAPQVVAQNQAPAPAPVARPVCGNCGTIDSVTPVQRQGKANGIGAVAGGVAGALLGHQVGNGNGKTLATVLGGVAGGFAGNAIEKNVKKETVYSVHLTMEDGSTRTLEQASAPPVGAKVTVEGNTLRTSNGAVVGGPAPAQARPAPATGSYNVNPG